MSIALALVLLGASGWATGNPERIARGKAVYEQGCVLCHGRDGRGNPEWENPVRPVEFSDCGTTAEATEQWETIVRKGGPARGLASVMPAFAESYNDKEIGAVVAYLRTFCVNADAFPPGDLNFRRLLKTGKAFPEAEVVLGVSHRPKSGARETELEMAYENRIGPRFQYELVLPVRAEASPGGGRGVGDVELEAKQVLHFDAARLQILSAGIGVTLPTGSTAKGLGNDTVLLSPFVAHGKGWGRTLLQAKVGADIPTDAGKADTAVTYAVGLSRALGPPRTAWTPALELTGTYNTRTRRPEHSVWVEASKPLNRLGHVIGSVGAQLPIRPSGDSWRIAAYVLWDFGDGPVWVGW